jgi:hypothetical protein
MYGLLRALVPSSVALGTIVLNRLAITVVEAALLIVGTLVFRLLGSEDRWQPAERTDRAGA